MEQAGGSPRALGDSSSLSALPSPLSFLWCGSTLSPLLNGQQPSIFPKIPFSGFGEHAT